MAWIFCLNRRSGARGSYFSFLLKYNRAYADFVPTPSVNLNFFVEKGRLAESCVRRYCVLGEMIKAMLIRR